jgi:arginase family enzyme
MGITQIVQVLGSPLDVLDGEEKVEMKRAYIGALAAGREPHPNFLDPYEALIHLDPFLSGNACERAGKVPIETWLTPKPVVADLPLVTSASYKAFLEGNGCAWYSEVAGNFVSEILPNPFLMIGVDHSQTGGIVRTLSRRLGAEQLSVVILDAHLDMFDFELLYPVQRVLMAKDGYNFPRQPLYNNSFYGCGSFLKSLIEERAVFPENLFVIGVTDYPKQIPRDAEIQEVGQYIQTYMTVIEAGVNVVPKVQAESSEDGLFQVLNRIKTPYVYVSIDMDVGAFSTSHAVRFLNTVGMEEAGLYRTVKTIRDVLEAKHLKCLGMDLMEMDVHFAGTILGGVMERSYEIASWIIHMLAPTIIR